MRLRRLTSNQPSFKHVEFRKGFNIVVAERTKESTRKDSRNGLGKSTLIELIHFCLGKGTTKGQVPVVEELQGWEFTLELELFGNVVTLSRAVDDQRRIAVAGDFSSWPITPEWDEDETKFFISLAGLRDNLASDFFGLGSEDATPKYSPTFRSLISYFSRRGRDAYSSPFEHHRKQREWDKQVNLAFLLDLSWQDAAAWQVLKDEKSVVDQLARAVKEGVLPDYLGTEGALETERVRLTEQVERQEAELRGFRVHEDYREIEATANNLTERMHQLANQNFSDRQSIELYRSAAEHEAGTTATKAQLETVFAEVNLHFPEAVIRRLDDVAEFHRQVVANRREFLLVEIERLEHLCGERDALIEQLDAERASHMAVLRSHGALEEFQELQGRLADTRGALRDVEARMMRLKELNEAKDRYGRRVKDLETGARQRYKELREQRDRAIRFFNSNTEALYASPGRLIIDIGPTGFRFDVDIERARSSGVSNMKVFAFDLTLLQLWSEHSVAPGFVIHDSLLYDGVDERQKALALDLAARQAEQRGWQYICMLNSDELPMETIPVDSPARTEPILKLTDTTDDGMLLGRRFS